MESPLEHRLLDVVSEIGEFSKEVLKMSDYGRKESEHRKEAEEEMGDLFYSLITVANSLQIDLEKALNASLEKYEKRMKKGSAGSDGE